MYNRDGVTIFDNFLEQEKFDNMKSLLLSKYFNWSVTGIVAGGTEHSVLLVDPNFNIQMSNTVFRENREWPKNKQEEFKVFIPIFSKMKEIGINVNTRNLIRVKANGMFAVQNKMGPTGWHVDVPPDIQGKGMTSIFYFNTCDGRTHFRDETIPPVDSVENRLLIFPNQWSHSSEHQSNIPLRCVLNINWHLTD